MAGGGSVGERLTGLRERLEPCGEVQDRAEQVAFCSRKPSIAARISSVVAPCSSAIASRARRSPASGAAGS
jgi:hypothetical protein